MPKLKRSPTEQKLRDLGLDIFQAAERRDISIDSLGKTAGLKRSAMYDRKRDPGLWRVSELIPVCTRLGIEIKI